MLNHLLNKIGGKITTVSTNPVVILKHIDDTFQAHLQNFPFSMLTLFVNLVNVQPHFIVNRLLMLLMVYIVFYLLLINLAWYIP